MRRKKRERGQEPERLPLRKVKVKTLGKRDFGESLQMELRRGVGRENLTSRFGSETTDVVKVVGKVGNIPVRSFWVSNELLYRKKKLPSRSSSEKIRHFLIYFYEFLHYGERKEMIRGRMPNLRFRKWKRWWNFPLIDELPPPPFLARKIKQKI